MRTAAHGACHCGAARFAALVNLAAARRCDCSFCRMRGAVAVSAPVEGLTVTAGSDALRRNTFGTHAARHWFCGICGIYTHHRRRSNPAEYGVNLACPEGHDLFLAEVAVVDGRAQPSDGAPPRIAGRLRWEPAP